jgi:microcystin-dependent protein
MIDESRLRRMDKRISDLKASLSQKGDAGQFIPMSYLDTDGTLAANSDEKVPSQKAVKTYADTKITAPAANTGDYLPQWDGNNSKKLKNGLLLDTDGTLSANSNERISPQKAVKDYVDARIPTGVILPFGGSSAPSGYLLCNGAAVSRTTHANLFSVIGTTYGAGDGSTTFNVPDMRGYVPVGYKSGDADFGTLGGAKGAKTHTLTVAEVPSTVVRDRVTQEAGAFSGVYDNLAAGYWKHGNNIDGGQAHNNIQPSRIVNYIIKT